ncbi:polysaccharide deacetylase family protein [Reyranella sp.]|uniref:polysaccharide deacetylase family protein n=1 Tax=Reyranella sp. TaxID=1929291 RepID=UPI003BAC4E09
MSGWHDLAEEAARWQDSGAVADLWFRDDDAAEDGPALQRLLELHRGAGVPVALAVVPSRAASSLADRLAREEGVDILQHGYAHADHAGTGEKKIELGAQRPAMLVLGELGTGWLALERLFGARPLRVLVPPWNRIAPALVPTLPEIGFTGLSTFGARRRERPVTGLLAVNTHVDLIDWRQRRFVGEAAALDALVSALRQSRTSSREPVGVLGHHLVMDDEAWDFLRSMLERTKMSGLRVRPARELFAIEDLGREVRG